jgi:hypothetical protein
MLVSEEQVHLFACHLTRTRIADALQAQHRPLLLQPLTSCIPLGRWSDSGRFVALMRGLITKGSHCHPLHSHSDSGLYCSLWNLRLRNYDHCRGNLGSLSKLQFSNTCKEWTGGPASVVQRRPEQHCWPSELNSDLRGERGSTLSRK